jgi:hypothetical protein
VPTLKVLKVGNYLLELCTPRAGEIEALKELPEDRRIGIGVVNPKTEIVESMPILLMATGVMACSCPEIPVLTSAKTQELESLMRPIPRRLITWASESDVSSTPMAMGA